MIQWGEGSHLSYSGISGLSNKKHIQGHTTVKPILKDHCHGRPAVSKDHIFLAEGTTFQYKRSRGLYTLLGHLLDKRISVRYKLTTVVAVHPFLKIKVKSRYNVVKNRKCTAWLQTELEHLRIKSTLHTVNTYPRGPNCGPFRSITNRFWETRSSIIGNAPNDPKLNFLNT